ncbi:hypothetical protein ELQ90_00470 [Labedella phragmitis]|uniref:Uncharacterized protein n=1 Tax=Labedella phragmitis TaxID=2498849 RepID=A0A444PX61_9MICO|nr:DUF6264 family protein [Labedella phragmitis]RWZ52472.1 hypothetical protein ELQ90_00470 [Labedella phragmitis]
MSSQQPTVPESTPQGSTPPLAGPGDPPPRRSAPWSTGRKVDVTASIVLMVLGVIGFVFLAFISLFFAMISDGCMSGTCDYSLMTVGYLLALAGPPVVFVAAIVWTIARLTRGKRAWWVPLVGAVAALAVWGVAIALMQASLGR